MARYNYLTAEYVKPVVEAISEGPSSSHRKNDGVSEPTIINHSAKMKLLTQADDVETAFDEQLDRLMTKLSEFQERDSGWALQKLIKLEININKACLTRGSHFIETPKNLANKLACLNIQNREDNFCFKWCLVAALYVKPLNNPNRTTSYRVDISQNRIQLSSGIELIFDGLQFPLALADIKKFEKMNGEISVNVFGYEGEEVVGPYYLTKQEKANHVNLILLYNADKFHYILITNMSRLLSKQISDHNGEIYICNSCLQHFVQEITLIAHKRNCGSIVCSLPQGDKAMVTFKNFERQMKVPFVVYADFECALEPIVDELNFSNTKRIKKHIPYAFSYLIQCNFDNNLNRFRLYTGEDAPKKFIENIMLDCKDIYHKYLRIVVPMTNLTPEENEDFDRSIYCHICEQEIGEDKVQDHCHLTGKYRGAAHSNCNLQYKIPHFIPIFFHNFSSYDCHLFVKDLVECEGETTVIPLNKEVYIAMSNFIPMDQNYRLELRFLDSFRFMSASLDSISRNLSDDMFHNTKIHFPQPADFLLMKRKGVFPYDYISSFQKLSENRLPPITDFFNSLTNSECLAEDYKHAQDVWENFGCHSLKDYMELYLKTDVLLLSDIFENFREIFIRVHKLDPCHYFTSPGMAWGAFTRRITLDKIEIHLLTDINMHNFVKKGISGGIVQCSKRHSVANNEYMENYDALKEIIMHMYVDANNLYGYGMSQSLPQKDFDWIVGDERFLLNFYKENIANLPHDSEIGYILEVDIHCPKQFHDFLNDFPPCPENKKPFGLKFCKLITDFVDKDFYIIHYRNLQQALSLGLVLKKVHRILSFVQSNYMQKFVDINSQCRAATDNPFEKDFFKLLNNAVYGKTMENVDKRKDVKLVKYWERTYRNRLGARDLIAKPNFNSLVQFSDETLAIQLNKVKAYYDKPIFMGFAILEASKWFMYDFYYNFLVSKFQRDVSLLYIDTDSFILEFRGRDFYKELSVTDIKERFDTSNYPINNRYNIPLVNKKVVGMMKDENCGRIMTEFVGLRPKMYAIKIEGDKEVKKAKGVKKSVLKKYNIDSYRDCLLRQKLYRDEMITFRSVKHQIYTNKVKKVTLSYSDDKRFINPDGVTTYAWGHYNSNIALAVSDESIDLNSIEPMEFDVNLDIMNTSDLATLEELGDLDL
ncbi:uncharacterized protein LOC142235565 [Haematobia irritans]|uniref:uncharacterized protein LOC142235565 n=1 Tax=Haematobia irritans TaxID=7368 RepID=UPI003F50C866